MPHTELPRALSELNRVLSHGVLFLGLKEGEGEEWTSSYGGARRYFAYYRASAVEEALSQAGFRITSLDRAADSSRLGRNWINAYARKEM